MWANLASCHIYLHDYATKIFMNKGIKLFKMALFGFWFFLFQQSQYWPIKLSFMFYRVGRGEISKCNDWDAVPQRIFMLQNSRDIFIPPEGPTVRDPFRRIVGIPHQIDSMDVQSFMKLVNKLHQKYFHTHTPSEIFTHLYII